MSSVRTAQSEFNAADVYRYDRRSPLRWIASHLWRYPALPIIFTLTVTGMSVFQASAALLLGGTIDAVRNQGGWDALLSGALSVAAVWLVFGLCDLSNSWAGSTLAQRVERDARDELFHELLGKGQRFHALRPVGEVMARATNDVQQLKQMLSPHAGLILEATADVVVPLAIIVTLDPLLLTVPLAYLVIFAVTVSGYGRELQPLAVGLREAFGRFNAALVELISGIDLVQGFVQQVAARERIAAAIDRYRALFVREGAVQARFLLLLFHAVTLGAGLGLSLWLLAAGRITLGQVIAYMALLEALAYPTRVALLAMSQIQAGLAGAQRILELINAEDDLDHAHAGHTAEMRGEIVLREVSFDYGDGVGAGALHNVSLAIPAGSSVALIGRTGSGKSTLTRLLNRIYDADRGSVTIDGVDVRNWDLATLRGQIATIEQDIFLFSRSVADNIAFGARGAVDRAAIVAAAKTAEAHEFISALPDGYDTLIGERGTTLSGGQRQRLAIARALLADPRILIIDDSTSALDSATEDRIQRALARVMQGRTTILITHRLNQIRRADQILLLQNGRLSAAGSHDELLELSPAYRRLFDLPSAEKGAAWAH